MSDRFWPGYRWRILAHERTSVGRKGSYTGRTYDRRSGKGPLAMTDGPTDIKYVDRDKEAIWGFDELAIDHWFHLEQMDERDWWIGVGNPDSGDYFHINVHINGDKSVSVSVDDQQAGDET
jgi:hypothetical protein